MSNSSNYALKPQLVSRIPIGVKSRVSSVTCVWMERLWSESFRVDETELNIERKPLERGGSFC